MTKYERDFPKLYLDLFQGAEENIRLFTIQMRMEYISKHAQRDYFAPFEGYYRRKTSHSGPENAKTSSAWPIKSRNI